MKRDIIKVVDGVSNHEERLSSGWRFVSCDEVKEGGALREEAITLLNDLSVAAPVGSVYRLRDGQMCGKMFQNINYNVVDGPGHDNTEGEMEFALMTKHTAVNLKIFRAKNLNKADNSESLNPFVVIWLINKNCRTPHGYARTDYNSLTNREKGEFIVFQQETTVKMNTMNPEWNEEFHIYICPSDELLLLDVYDWNKVRKNKCLGRAVVEGVCETDKKCMDESLENPFKIELSSIVGTTAFHGKPSKLFIGYNVHDCSNDNTINVPANDSRLDPVPQMSSNDAELDVHEAGPLPDNWEERVDQTGRTIYLNHSTNTTGDSTLHQYGSESTNGAQDHFTIPRAQEEMIELLTLQNDKPDNNETPQSPDNESRESSGLNQPIDGDEATNRNIPYNDSNNNNSLDSSYYSWQNIMQRFKDLPFDEPNSQRIQREIREFYRRSMTNGVQVEQSAIHGAAANNEKCIPREAGGMKSCAKSASADQVVSRAGHGPVDTTESCTKGASAELAVPAVVLKVLKGASNINPSSQNYKARYEAFINQQKAAAAKLIFSERLELQMNRETVFADAFDKISRIPQDRIHILRAPIVIGECVRFDGAHGMRHEAFDAVNEWFSHMFKSMFNPYYGLFEYSAYDNHTLQINPNSGGRDKNHLDHLKLIGQVTGMAVFHQKPLNAFFIRPFYKMMLGKPITRLDFEAIDYEYFQSLQWIRENEPYVLGRSIISRIKEQMDHFMEGFNDVIPLNAIKIFAAGELELLISGIGELDLEDLKNNTRYHGYYGDNVIKWFWELMSSSAVLRSRLLLFVTGTSRVPANGFKDMHGSKGTQKITIRKWGRPEDLPKVHTSTHRLDLPPYETYSDLEEKLNMAIRRSF